MTEPEAGGWGGGCAAIALETGCNTGAPKSTPTPPREYRQKMSSVSLLLQLAVKDISSG